MQLTLTNEHINMTALISTLTKMTTDVLHLLKQFIEIIAEQNSHSINLYRNH